MKTDMTLPEIISQCSEQAKTGKKPAQLEHLATHNPLIHSNEFTPPLMACYLRCHINNIENTLDSLDKESENEFLNDDFRDMLIEKRTILEGRLLYLKQFEVGILSEDLLLQEVAPYELYEFTKNWQCVGLACTIIDMSQTDDMPLPGEYPIKQDQLH